jgi:YggT family protein
MTLLGLLGTVIEIYTVVVIVRMFMSWFPVVPGNSWEPLYNAVFVVTEPPLAAIRSVVAPIRTGAGALDLSPLLLVIGLQVLRTVLYR